MGGRAQTRTKDSRISQKPKPPWLRYRVKSVTIILLSRALFGCSSSSKRCAQHFLWNFVGIFHVWIEFVIKCQKKHVALLPP